MTASVPFRADGADLVGQMCQATIDGRRAGKTLGALLKQFELAEPEFEILWCLAGATCGVDQTTLAGQLAFSAAQVSACVEKLRVRGLIAQHAAPGDRRRHLWQVTDEARVLLEKIVLAVGSVRSDIPHAPQVEAAA